MTAEELASREEIRHLMSIYNTAGDRMHLDELASVFTEDGILEATVFRFQGHREIVEGLGGASPGRSTPRGTGTDPPARRRPTLVRHNLTTSRIELTGPEAATGRSYFVVFTEIGPDHAGVYVDEFAKVKGSWRIARRQVRIDWVADNAIMGTRDMLPEQRR
jgi:hypothetical protein